MRLIQLHSVNIEDVQPYVGRATSIGLHPFSSWKLDILCGYSKGILRSPAELREQYEDYREKVGTMSKVVGGICTIDSVCRTKMACVGCGAKVPRPEFKEEITAFYEWADESEKRFENLGLPLEANKMKIAKKESKKRT